MSVLPPFRYKHMVPLTIECLALAVFLGLGPGAVATGRYTIGFLLLAVVAVATRITDLPTSPS